MVLEIHERRGKKDSLRGAGMLLEIAAKTDFKAAIFERFNGKVIRLPHLLNLATALVLSAAEQVRHFIARGSVDESQVRVIGPALRIDIAIEFRGDEFFALELRKGKLFLADNFGGMDAGR
jgi:hypothetical protein